MLSRIHLFTALALAIIASAFIGCNGDTPATGTLPIAAAPPAGISSFTTESKAQDLALPPTAGFIGTISIPAALSNPGTTVKIYSGISPPTGTPIMQGSASGSQPAPTPLLYLAMTPQSEVRLSEAPSFSITLPEALPTSSDAFYIGFFDPSNPLAGYQPVFEGPAAVSGQTADFFTASSGALNFKADLTYCFSLYELPIPTPSPSP